MVKINAFVAELQRNESYYGLFLDHRGHGVSYLKNSKGTIVAVIRDNNIINANEVIELFKAQNKKSMSLKSFLKKLLKKDG